VKKGPPGQNNANPPGAFPNHELVKTTVNNVTKYYDPSYGVVYNSLQDFQDEAIQGFYVVREVNLGGRDVRAMLIRQNTAGAKLQITEELLPPP
jgi:hypothetical protein